MRACWHGPCHNLKFSLIILHAINALTQITEPSVLLYPFLFSVWCLCVLWLLLVCILNGYWFFFFKFKKNVFTFFYSWKNLFLRTHTHTEWESKSCCNPQWTLEEHDILMHSYELMWLNDLLACRRFYADWRVMLIHSLLICYEEWHYHYSELAFHRRNAHHHSLQFTAL